MKLTNRTLDILKENLICMANDTIKNKTIEEISVIELIAGVVVSAVGDYYNSHGANKESAINYFESSELEVHCDLLYINVNTMLRIIKNIDNDIKPYYQEYDDDTE